MRNRDTTDLGGSKPTHASTCPLLMSPMSMDVDRYLMRFTSPTAPWTSVQAGYLIGKPGFNRSLVPFSLIPTIAVPKNTMIYWI